MPPCRHKILPAIVHLHPAPVALLGRVALWASAEPVAFPGRGGQRVLVESWVLAELQGSAELWAPAGPRVQPVLPVWVVFREIIRPDFVHLLRVRRALAVLAESWASAA